MTDTDAISDIDDIRDSDCTLQGIQRSLGRVEGKLDQHLEMQKQRYAMDDAASAANDVRMGAAERKIHYGYGVLAAMLAFFGYQHG
jgi:hypothetical protein